MTDTAPFSPATTSSGSGQCIILGGPEALRTGFASALRARLARTLADPVAAVEIVDDRTARDKLRESAGPAVPTPDTDDLDVASCIVLLDAGSRRRRGWWDLRGRRAEYRHEDRLVDAATAYASNADTARLLVIAEVGEGDGMRGRRHALRVARSAAYEIEINGTPVTSVFYLVVGAQIAPSDALVATVRWALGRAGCKRFSAAR